VNETRAFEDQLPWLQPVEDEDEPRGVSARKMLAALLVVAMGAAIVAAAFFWLGQREAPVSGPPELIQALPGPYKVKPPNPGGLDISAESETAFETSAGEDRDAQLDTSKLPNRTAVKTTEQPKPEAAAEPAKPVAPEPARAPAPKATGGTGSVIQLGAFANKAQAERAWTALSSRFPSIAALNKMIVPFEHGMRLRAGAASAADARQACDTLKAAGENCFVAQ
jgi:cell division septation protein DedD